MGQRSGAIMRFSDMRSHSQTDTTLHWQESMGKVLMIAQVISFLWLHLVGRREGIRDESILHDPISLGLENTGCGRNWDWRRLCIQASNKIKHMWCIEFRLHSKEEGAVIALRVHSARNSTGLTSAADFWTLNIWKASEEFSKSTLLEVYFNLFWEITKKQECLAMVKQMQISSISQMIENHVKRKTRPRLSK